MSLCRLAGGRSQAGRLANVSSFRGAWGGGAAASAHLRAGRRYSKMPIPTMATISTYGAKINKRVLGLSGFVTTVGTLVGAYYWCTNKGVAIIDRRLETKLAAVGAEVAAVENRLSLAMKEESAKRQEFQQKATFAHQDLVRKTDNIHADLRSQLNDFEKSKLHHQQAELFYRAEVVKAEEAIMKAGGLRRSADQYMDLIKKIT